MLSEFNCAEHILDQLRLWKNHIQTRMKSNFKYQLFACLLSFSTTHCLSCWSYHYKWVFLFVSVPLEMHILTREYFNRWYSVLPSFLAIVLIEIPIQVWDTTVYHFTVWSRIMTLSVHNPLNLNMLQTCCKKFNTNI